MNRHLIGFIGVLVVGTGLLVGGYYALPRLFDSIQRNTSDAGDATGTVRIGIDNWVGYVPLCSKELRRRMHLTGLLVQCQDDNADYAQRMKQLGNGELELAVATVDSFLLNGVTEKFPGTIVMVIDESSGGDAIVARKDRIASLDDFKTKKGLKIAFTEKSPSEHLLKAIGVHFDVPLLRDRQGAWRVTTQGSAEAFKALQSGQVDAAVLWEPDVTRALALGTTHKILGTENTKRLIVDVLIANREFVKRSPQAVSALLANYFRTLKYFRDTPNALRDEVKAATRVEEEQIDVMLKGVRWTSLVENAHAWFGIGGAPPGGEGLIDAIESAAQILVDNGDFTTSPVPEQDPYRLQYRVFVEDLFTNGVDSPFASIGSGASIEASTAFTALANTQWDALREIGTLKVRPITFQSGTSELKLDGKLQLDIAASNLSHYPNFRIVIHGHTGSRGDRVSNKDLSLARADAVKRYLMVTHGIDEARLHTVGYGGERPVARVVDEPDRAYEYRLPRVELSLVSESY